MSLEVTELQGGGVHGGDEAAAGGPDHGHAEGHGAAGRLWVS